MKIALARRGFSKTGGAEAYLTRFAQALHQAGHQPVLFGSPEWPQAQWPGGNIERIATETPRAFAEAVERQWPQSGCDYLFSLERVWRCDAYRAGDGVHRAWLERREALEPLWKRLGRRFNRKHRQLLEIEARLFSPEGAGVVIANSHLVKDEITAHYDYPAERIHVVYNGLPPQEAPAPGERERLRARFGFRETTSVFLFAGSGWERKGLAWAIRAFRRAAPRDAALLVAGKGNPAKMPKHTQVHYAGPVRPAEMPAFYAAADAFILPTLYDPFSNATLEAFAAGLPVITTRSNGFSEVITSGIEGSLIAHPSDLDGLAKAITFWSDRHRCEAIRPRLVERGRGFSIEANLQATLKIITQAPG
ncbi:MAG TPA: glycosyltransferase family 4 protein [Chthoniobacteraceae bacterium]|nr:glycosyltransferase family 4 protein [Chthoniobacteraceae bacterium]